MLVGELFQSKIDVRYRLFRGPYYYHFIARVSYGQWRLMMLDKDGVNRYSDRPDAVIQTDGMNRSEPYFSIDELIQLGVKPTWQVVTDREEIGQVFADFFTRNEQ